MCPSVFISRNLPGIAEELLCEGGCHVKQNRSDEPCTPEELKAGAAEADGLLCFLHDKITPELLQSASRCRVIANYAVGYDNFDVAAATQAGVALCNTPDVLTTATAELAWALLLAAARRLGESERLVRRGEFHGWGPMMLVGQQVSGKTLGIIGAGRIGSAVARMSRGYSMQVVYTRRSGVNPELESLGARRVDLEELLSESDFVSVHAPLTPKTHHLISAKQLFRMKRTAVLVNTARGQVVDEAALAHALREGWIAAAGLDVYEREPRIQPELLTLENVVLAPHIGSATWEARNGMAELAAWNLLDFFAGRVPRNCINPEYLENQ